MLYSCTHMATVGVKGLTQERTACIVGTQRRDELPCYHGRRSMWWPLTDHWSVTMTTQLATVGDGQSLPVGWMSTGVICGYVGGGADYMWVSDDGEQAGCSDKR